MFPELFNKACLKVSTIEKQISDFTIAGVCCLHQERLTELNFEFNY